MKTIYTLCKENIKEMNNPSKKLRKQTIKGERIALYCLMVSGVLFSLTIIGAIIGFPMVYIAKIRLNKLEKKQ